MRAIKKAKRIIEKDPTQPVAKFLTSLVLSLESDNEFPTRQLYELSIDDFDFALQILKEWPTKWIRRFLWPLADQHLIPLDQKMGKPTFQIRGCSYAGESNAQ